MTLEEIADKVIKDLGYSNKRQLKKMKKEDLIGLHHGFGTSIRNEFKLWNSPEITGSFHPDEVSQKIIEIVWGKLRGGQW